MRAPMLITLMDPAEDDMEERQSGDLRHVQKQIGARLG